MATTTNYGWETPDDTDLVKDGAAAIRTLGSSIDTTIKNLNPETTLGDLAYRSSTANVKTRLGIGTTGQVLSVSSGGLPAWETPNVGGMTSLATATANNSASLSFTSLSSAYRTLYIVLNNFYPATDNADLFFRINNDSGFTYVDQPYATETATAPGTTRWTIQANPDNTVARNLSIITIPEYANTSTWKFGIIQSATVNGTTTTSVETRNRMGVWFDTSAINRIDVLYDSGNITAGTATIYGVK